MKCARNFVLLILLHAGFVSVLTMNAQAQSQAACKASSEAGPKLRLAVADLSAAALKSPPPVGANLAGTPILPPTTEISRSLTEMLTTALVNNSRFVVIERAALEKVTAEQDLGTSAKVSAVTAPGVGKLIGAQAVITGDITEFSYSQSGIGGTLAGFHGLGSKLGKQKVTATVAIDLRIVDAAIGQVLAAQHAQGNATMSNVSANVLKGSQDINAVVEHDTPMGEASRQALDKAVYAIEAGMKTVRWSARVIDVREDRVYINAGSVDGICVAREFEVFHPGDALN